MKITKNSRNLLISMLIGDGTISNNYVYKLSHCEQQKEYLEYKISLLNKHGLKNNGLKSYISTNGYNKGKTVYYTQLSILKFVKVLRRVFYRPYKNIANIKLLNRIDEEGLAIWFMDDGCINIRKTDNKVHGFYIRISTCVDLNSIQILIDYFKSKWDIQFYKIKEKQYYSLCCGTTEGKKFIKIIEPYIIPSMKYKINYNVNQDLSCVAISEKQSTLLSEDIV